MRKQNICYSYIDRCLNRCYHELERIAKIKYPTYHQKNKMTKDLRCSLIYYYALKKFTDKDLDYDDIEYILENL
jgi:hypothetical protein